MTDIREELARALFHHWDGLAGGSLGDFSEIAPEAQRHWFDRADAILPIIERRIAAERKEERERCAAKAELWGVEYGMNAEDAGQEIAAAIRALGDK